MTNTVVMERYFEHEGMKGSHITRKETVAALWTLRRLLVKEDGSTHRRVRFITSIALDNTVAVTALNKMMGFDKDVDDLLIAKVIR